MKKQFVLSFILSFFAAVFLGAGIAMYFGLEPKTTIVCSVVVYLVYQFLFGNFVPEGIARAGINREIWVDKMKEKFWTEGTFLDGVDDWSEWVEFNTINFSNMGTDPVVLKNNAVWPIVAVQRTDTNGTVVLDTYDTTTTRIRNIEEIEESGNKLASVVKQHKMKLQMDIQSEAIWNYAPTGPTSATAPVVDTTGATRPITIRGGTLSSVGSRAKIEDLSTLQEQFDNQDFPEQGRVFVLCPTHRKDLMDQDATLFKQFSNLKAGQFLDIFGFQVTSYGRTPVYHKATKVKQAFGAAFDATNDVPASIAFIKQEVMKCMGDIEVFHKEKGINPEQRSDEIGFQMRAKAVSPRGQNAIGAIITARA